MKVKRTVFWQRLLVSVVLMAVAVPSVFAQPKVEQLLRQFEELQAGRIANPPEQMAGTANAFLEELRVMGFFDEPIRFTAKDGPDTLRQQVWYWAGEYFYDRQQYGQAVAYAQKALPLLHIPSEHADCLSLIAISFARQGDYPEAIRHARQCYELDEQSGDVDRISSSLNTLTGIYIGARQPREAEKYILRGIELCRSDGKSARTNNPGRLAVLLGKASEVYHQLADDVKSLDYARQAYEVELSLGRRDKIAIRLSQMASAYIGLKQTQAARDTLRRAIPILEESGNRQQLGICCNQMGGLLLGEGKRSEAAGYFERASQLFNELGDRYNESIALGGLAKSLRDSDPARAMLYMERYNELKDSLYSRETGQLLSEYAAQYGYEQLQLENLQAHRDNRKMMLVAVLVILVVLFSAVILYILSRRRSRKMHLELQQRLDALTADYNQLNSHYANAISPDGRIANPTEQNDDLSDADRQFLSRTISIINKQIDEGHVNVDAVASELCMSVSQFRRRLTSLTGETPKNYITAVRMQKARHLLDTQADLPVAEIALKCGYDENTNFTRAFKQFYGLTPSDYLKQ